MKIFCCDNTAWKFSEMILHHWRERGHEVYKEFGMNPEWLAWSDLTYIDWLDNNFYSAFNGSVGDHDAPDWKSYPKKRIAVRMIDLDIWQGRHNDPRIWPYLDDAIVINQFYYDKIHNETTPYSDGKLHLIRPGINLDTFAFKSDRQRGYKIGVVSGDMWEAKSCFEAIRIYQEVCYRYPNKPWELFIRGNMKQPEWHHFAYSQLINVSPHPENIYIIPQISESELVTFYQKIDYILVTSHKEAFSYAGAEGMATGAKPIFNNWFGSEWPDKYRFNSIHEAVEMIAEGDYNPQEYRQYIADNYDLKRMLAQYDELFGT